MKFLGCLFVLTFLGVFLLAAAAKSILRALFGPQPRQDSPRQSARENRSTQSQAKTTQTSKKRSKIFDKNEGEYVDFEEIKK